MGGLEEIGVLFKLLYAFKKGRVRPFCLITEKAKTKKNIYFTRGMAQKGVGN